MASTYHNILTMKRSVGWWQDDNANPDEMGAELFTDIGGKVTPIQRDLQEAVAIYQLNIIVRRDGNKNLPSETLIALTRYVISQWLRAAKDFYSETVREDLSDVALCTYFKGLDGTTLPIVDGEPLVTVWGDLFDQHGRTIGLTATSNSSLVDVYNMLNLIKGLHDDVTFEMSAGMMLDAYGEHPYYRSVPNEKLQAKKYTKGGGAKSKAKTTNAVSIVDVVTMDETKELPAETIIHLPIWHINRYNDTVNLYGYTVNTNGDVVGASKGNGDTIWMKADSDEVNAFCELVGLPSNGDVYYSNAPAIIEITKKVGKSKKAYWRNISVVTAGG